MHQERIEKTRTGWYQVEVQGDPGVVPSEVALGTLHFPDPPQ